MTRRLSITLKLTCAVAALAAAAPAYAQPEEEPEALVEEEQAERANEAARGEEVIFVTARRRAENITDVPLSITAYSGEQLENEGALDLTDIGDTTPNVTLEASRGTNSTLTAFIRGVGQQDPVGGFEAGVGIYLDDVYLNRPQAALLDIYNVERIEVLRGPQGTLYGRNTIGGAIKYVTRRMPQDPELRVRATVGTYEQADLVVSASTPVSGDRIVRAGASVARLTRDGFGDNLTTGEDNYNRDIWAGRLSLEVNNDSNVFVRLQGDLTQDDSNARGGHRLIPGLVSGAPVLADEFDTRGGLAGLVGGHPQVGEELAEVEGGIQRPPHIVQDVDLEHPVLPGERHGISHRRHGYDLQKRRQQTLLAVDQELPYGFSLTSSLTGDRASGLPQGGTRGGGSGQSGPGSGLVGGGGAHPAARGGGRRG